jgi:hypothetical protein
MAKPAPGESLPVWLAQAVSAIRYDKREFMYQAAVDVVTTPEIHEIAQKIRSTRSVSRPTVP